MHRPTDRLSLFFVCAIVAAGCGGSGSSPSSPPTSKPSSPPTSAPPAPFSVATSVPVAAVAGVATVASSSGPYGAQLKLPVGGAFAGETALVTLSNNLPPGFPATLSERIRPDAVNSSTSVVESVCVEFPATVISTAPASLTAQLPAGVITAGDSFYMALFNVTTGALNANYGGPAQPAGTSVTLTGTYSLTFQANQNECLAVYELNSTTAPPHASSPIVAVPGSIPLTAPGQTAIINVAETGYSANFSAISSNPAVASISPAQGSKSFTVTAQKTAGSAIITFQDTNGQTASVNVTLTLTNGVIK